MKGILKTLVGPVASVTLDIFRNQCENPGVTQNNVLLDIIRQNVHSTFGKDHSFQLIQSVDSFRREVPVCTYESLFPYIEKSLAGEPQQLTYEQPILFATTSGTTGTPKYIPITPESKSSKSKLMRIWLAALLKDYPNIFDGKILTVVSPEVESYSSGGIPCGTESGHGYKSMAAAVKGNYAIPYEVFEIKNYEAKYYAILRIACAEVISLLYTPNPSTLLLLADRMGDYSGQIIQDIRQGTLSRAFEIEPEYRAIIENSLKADPARAAQLESAAAKEGGRLIPRDVWPQLACICCWKGGTVGMYLDKFDRFFSPETPVRDIGYYASEVRGSVVISEHGSAGVLSITENFFEFLPVDSVETDPDQFLMAHELELDGQYYIYVTTKAGLYRYEMNDIIEVASYFGKTPVIRFVQKGKGVVSFTGEKLYEAQVIAAVENVLEDKRGSYSFIGAVGEIIDEKPRYNFLIEFAESVNEVEGQSILQQLDFELGAQNTEYKTKRDSGRISFPVLSLVEPGAFNLYRQREVAKGRNDGQFKTLRLTSDERFIKEFNVEQEIGEANKRESGETREMERKQLLQKHSLFKFMNDDLLEQFLSLAEERHYNADDVLYDDMGESQEVFFVLDGLLLHQFSLVSNDRSLAPIRVGKGEVTNAVAVIDSGPTYVSCVAESEVTLLVWKAEDIKSLCTKHPDAGYPFVCEVARMLASRMQQVNQRLLDSMEWGL